MDVGDVMDDLAAACDTITGLRCFAYTPGTVTAPAAIVGFPEVEFDGNMRRGMDQMTTSVYVVVDAMEPRAARDRLVQYAAGSGSLSVKAAIESYASSTWDSVRVQSVKFESLAVGGVDYSGATFVVDVAGSGS